MTQLPPDVVQEMQNFIEFLLQERAAQPRAKPEFQWAGALKDLREQYSAVALQHQVTKWKIAENKRDVEEGNGL